MSEINVYVCRSKAIAKNYHQALQEKTIEKEARVQAQQRLETVESQIKRLKTKADRFKKKNESVQELRRSLNELTTIKETHDRAEKR